MNDYASIGSTGLAGNLKPAVSVSWFTRVYSDGLAAELQELLHCFIDMKTKLFGSKNPAIKIQADEDARGKRVTLGYGFRGIATVLGANVLVIPSVCLNYYTHMTTRTLIVCHLLLAFYLMAGCIFCRLIHGFLIEGFLPEIDERIGKLLTGIVDFCAMAYNFLSFATSQRFLWHRTSLSRFLRVDCALTYMDAERQRIFSVRALMLATVGGLFTEPLLFVATVFKALGSLDIISRQSTFTQFIIQTGVLMIEIPVALSLVCAMQAVPVMAALLSVALAANIKQTLHEIVFPLRKTSGISRPIVSTKSQRHIKQSLLTLELDWPSRDNMHRSIGSVANKMVSAIKHPPAKQRCDSDPANDRRRSSIVNPIVHRHVLIYRKLVQTIVVVRNTCRAFESMFSGLHMCYIGLSTFVLATLVLMNVLRTRLDAEDSSSLKSGHYNLKQGFDVTSIFTGFLVTCLIAHVAIETTLLTFTNRLPSRLQELKYELFQMNLDMLPQTGDRKRQLLAKGRKTNFHAADYEERFIIEAWYLYDEMVRLTDQARLKFDGRFYYSKRLMLTILGEKISFCLLYAQSIDVYTMILRNSSSLRN